MKRTALLVVSSLVLAAVASTKAEDKKDGWIRLFDGKTLDGWKSSEDPDSFSVHDEILVAHAKGKAIDGQAPHAKSHLFYVGSDGKASFKNFVFQCDVKTQPNANSGIYFHTDYVRGNWPQKGFEVQINNSYKDKKKTGSLYAVQNVAASPAKDNKWFHVSIKVNGKHVVIKVDGKTVVDWIEPEGFKLERKPWYSERRLSSGTFALQAHDPKSIVYFKNLMVKPLP